MQHNYFKAIEKDILVSLSNLYKKGHLQRENFDESRLTVEPPRDPSHGDVATNVALILSKQVGLPPRELAALLKEELLAFEHIKGVEIAGPGFLNLTLSDSFWQSCLKVILHFGDDYGSSEAGKGTLINVEYVSTNPTGPMHIGHSRGAIVGDALARLLKKVGYSVVKEYYVNDAGAQVQSLARSLYARYQEKLGVEGGNLGEYSGDYLIPVAEALVEEDGDQWCQQSEDAWGDRFRSYAVQAMMAMIQSDLALLNVHHDIFVSERALVEAGQVDSCLAFLREKGLVYEGILEPPKGKPVDDYEPRVQTLFKSTEFGDDVDRPLKKSDGSWTYFANDIAYHYDKVKRGASRMINVWGADHGGYVKRMASALQAMTDRPGTLSVVLCQMVKFMEEGVVYTMSKRAGTFISLREALDKVGRDALRFMMLTRKSDAPLDFDFAKAVEQTKDNPVFYVQYAGARCHSILRCAHDVFPGEDFSRQKLEHLDLGDLTDPSDLALVRLLATWPRHVNRAAVAEEPHRIAYFLQEVAAGFHSLWNQGKEASHLKFIHEKDLPKTRLRLALIQAVLSVLKSGLDLLGVALIEEM